MSAGEIYADPHNIHSAITTWSGFVYQGKVALYHVIKLITTNEGASTYSLQLDSLEDFAIMTGPNSCLSLHQIKALKSDLYSSYSSAFDKLCGKKTEFNCDNLFFHLAVQIRDKDKATIEQGHAGMNIYEYHDGKHHCPLSAIDDALNMVLTAYYQKQENTRWKANTVYVDISRKVLDAKIQEKVVNIHSLVHANIASDNELAYSQTIPFQVFIDILNEDLNDQTTNEAYFLAQLLSDFNSYYQEFCFNCIEPVKEDDKKKMNSFIAFVNTLNNHELLKFCRQILPHRKMSLRTINEYKNHTFHKDEMKDAFFKALYELRDSSPSMVEKLGWDSHPNGFFVPTAISRNQDAMNEVCHDIIDNIMETDIDLPYQATTLVTAYMNTPSINDVVNNVTRIDDEFTNTDSDKVVRWKKIALSSIAEVKKHIT